MQLICELWVNYYRSKLYSQPNQLHSEETLHTESIGTFLVTLDITQQNGTFTHVMCNVSETVMSAVNTLSGVGHYSGPH